MTATPSILVTGAHGQLGTEIGLLSVRFPALNFLLEDIGNLSITDPIALDSFFKTHKPAYCINAAAYTAVDKAESDRDEAWKVNAIAVGELATICKKYGTRLIHISTDYVFPGDGKQPYKESDPVDPVNAYGESKAAGEKLAFEKNDQTMVIRTSWLYSPFGNNFLKTMVRLMNEREIIGVVNDQFGSPTYAGDLAGAILRIIDKGNFVPGIYHYCNTGNTSWYEFALGIKELINSNCKVNPIDTSAYPTAAKRPHYSVLDTTKIKAVYGIQIPFWKDSLQVCIKKLDK